MLDCQDHGGRGPGIGGYESLKTRLKLNQHKFVDCVREEQDKEGMETESKNIKWDIMIKSPKMKDKERIFFKLFYCCSIIVVCLFSPPLYATPAKTTSLPCFHPPPWFCPCVLYTSSWKPFRHCPLPPSLAIVRLFLISMSLVIFCLLFSSVDYVPVKGDMIWYLSLSTWVISLSIILSSSMHAVQRV